MSRKFKKLLALVLAAVTVLGSMPNLVYAEDSAYTGSRKTDFFPDSDHTELDFEEIKFVQYDTSEFYKNMEEIRNLYEENSNITKVQELFLRNGEIYDEINTMYNLANIYLSKDVTSEKAFNDYWSAYEIALKVNDDFLLLAKEILQSECSEALEELLTDEDIESILDSEQMTKEQEQLSNQEQELINQYQQLAIQPFTVEYQGNEIDENQLVAAYYSGEIDYDTTLSLLNQIYKKMNSVLGEVFLKLVDVRNKQAASYGYSNYGDFVYTERYFRDYTQTEIQEFQSAIKQNFPLIYQELSLLQQYNTSKEFMNTQSSMEDALEMLKMYIPKLSSEMEEALNYMIDHHFYDFEYSASKQEGAYTTDLGSYNAPFIMAQPTGGFSDFSGTVVHEFGHYNSFYYNPVSWNRPSLNIDLAEIHSQGLETLFLKFYPEIFKEDADAAQCYTIRWLVASLMEGCVQDELQQYIYSEKDLTLEKINKKYMDILIDYGYNEESQRGLEAYQWVLIPHTFQSPFYYISYAVSAAAAFEVWMESQGDYDHAVDQYLELVSYGYEQQFRDTLDKAGYEDPLTEEFISDLAVKIEDIMELEEKITEILNTEIEENEQEEEKEDSVPDQKEETKPEVTPPTPVYQIYTVRTGDTLAKIAAQHKVKDWREIAKINKIVSPYKIYAGQNIYLPENAVMKKETYIVKDGDTLGKIGSAYEIDWRVIAQKNGISAPYTIYVGQKLILEY